MYKIAVLALFVAVAFAVPAPEEKYKSRLDNINVKDVLKNDRLVENYVKCALDKGKCTPEGKDIKEQILDLLPEILETNCGKCTDQQREKAKEVLHYLHEKRRSDFDEILNKYDENKELRNKYKEKYSGLAKDEGFSEIFA